MSLFLGAFHDRDVPSYFISIVSYCIQVNLDMTDDMLGPSPMHIKYSSYVYDGFCI